MNDVWRKHHGLFLVATAVLALVACSGGSGEGSQDPAPLALVAVQPADRASDVPRTVQPALAFTADVDPASLNTGGVALMDDAGTVVAVNLAVKGPGITVVPAAPLWPDTAYRIGVEGVTGRRGELPAMPSQVEFVTRDGVWMPSRVQEALRVPSVDGESLRLAMGRDGIAVAAWLSPGGAHPRVWASRRLRDGRWEAPVPVGEAVDGEAAPPAVAMEPDGTAHVAWSSYEGSGQSHVYTSRRGEWAPGWDTAVRLSLPAHRTNIEPAIAAGASGGVYAAWTSGGSLPYEIHVARLQDDGEWSAPIRANEPNGRNVLAPGIAVDRHDRALLVWPEQDGAAVTLSSRRFARDVTVPRATGPAAAVGGPAAPVVRFSLALNGDGSGVLAWETGGAAPGRTIWVALYTDGVGWGSTMSLDGEDTDDFQPAAAVAGDGGAIVAWTGAVPPAGGRRVFVRRLDRSGILPASGGWSPAEELSGASGGLNPGVALDERGNGLVLWQPASDEIRASRFTLRRGWQPSVSVHVPPGALQLFPAQVGFDGSGSALAAWLEADFVSQTAGPLLAVGGASFE